MTDMDKASVIASHRQELRRGTVVVACLVVLQQPGYGYALLETLARAGFDVEANTLYPLLRRLESQGLLESDWNTDDARPRKFYRTTPEGMQVADTLRREWVDLSARLDDLRKES